VDRAVVRELLPWSVMENDWAQKLRGYERRYTAVSDYLFDVSRDSLCEYIPRKEAYEDTFDRLEYLFALLHLHEREREGRVWAPIGRCGWRDRDRRVFKALRQDAEAARRQVASAEIRSVGW
jgi:hypothetical protein